MKPKNLKGSSLEGTFIAKDGKGINIDPSYAIFPIIKHDQSGIISLLGTGFFISDHGIFITAKHVLMDVLDKNGFQTHGISLVQFLGGSYVIRPILRCTSHEVADISVGVSAPMTNNKTGELLKNKILKLTSNTDEIGSHVFTYAYPKSVVNHVERQELHFFPDYYEGIIEKNFPFGRDKVMLPGPCLQTNMYIHGGASGGPVFNKMGLVCGINSTGYEDDSLSFITPVHTIENLLLADVKTPNNSTGQITIKELIDDNFISYEM